MPVKTPLLIFILSPLESIETKVTLNGVKDGIP